MAIKIKNSIIVDDDRNIIAAGIITATSISIGNTEIITSDRRIVNITGFDVTGVSTFQSLSVVGIVSAETLNVVGASTFQNGPVYIGGNLGIGTTNPQQNLDVEGNIKISGSIYDVNDSPGSGIEKSILVSTGTGITWTPPYVAGLQGVQGITGTSIKIVGTLALTIGIETSQLNDPGNTWYPAQAGDGVIDSVDGDLWVAQVGIGTTTWASVGQIRGSQGLQGVSGNQGVQGIIGPQGITGTQGFDGIQGFDGSQGIQGTIGPQGVQGITGTQGFDGTQGTFGTQGIQGTIGPQGVQGFDGTQGVQGTLGIQGVQGTLGIQGVQGFFGTQGVQGTLGIQGVQGTTGSQGVQGTLGIQGVQGTLGIQGVQGTLGIQGVQGTTGSQGVQGFFGTQGVQGLLGIQGSIGPVATTFDIDGLVNVLYEDDTVGVGTTSVSAIKTYNLPSNTYNAIITEAEISLEVPSGGDCIGDFYISYNGVSKKITTLDHFASTSGDSARIVSPIKIVDAFTGGGNITIGSTINQVAGISTWRVEGFRVYGVKNYTFGAGPQGVQGVQGTIGSQGVQGFFGTQGVQGTLGIQGVQGTTGSQGVQGFFGTQGVQGTIGSQGVQGFFGTQGVQGIQGPIASEFTISNLTNLVYEDDSVGIGTTSIADAKSYTISSNDYASIVVEAEVSLEVGTAAASTCSFDISYGNTVKKVTLLRHNASTAGTGDAALIVSPIKVVDAFTAGGKISINPTITQSVGISTWRVEGFRVYGVKNYTFGAGPQGVQGVQGFFGTQGVQGTLGIQGVQGFFGTQGVQGTLGIQGVQGITGPSNIINATDDTATTTLYPVMVGATGSNQTAKARSTSQVFAFNASTNTLSVGNISLPQNPNGVGYGTTIAAPSFSIFQTMGNTDAWRIYGESPSGADTGTMVFEVNDNTDNSERFSFRTRKTFSAGGGTTLFDLTQNGNVMQYVPLLIGTATSTGTTNQRLQVNGAAYVSGNLGIGTTNPQTKLDVLGTGQFTSNGATLNLVGTDHSYIQWYPDGISSGRKAYTGFPGPDANYFELSNEISDGSGHIYLNPGTNAAVLIDTFTSTGTTSQPLQVSGGAYVSGNVGIGTTNPKSKLHVQGDFLVAAGSLTDQHITQKAYELNSGTLAWEGSVGQLFSITNNLSSGSIFSVNDVSGIPSIDVNANGTIELAPFGGNIGIGTTRPTSKLDVAGAARFTGIVTALQFSTGSGTLGFTTDTITGPPQIVIDPAVVGNDTGVVRIKGDLYVDGAQTYINSTTIEFADFNVGIATTVGTNILLDGAGIGIGSTAIRKTITWNNTAGALTSSEDWNLVSGKQYEINGTSVLAATTLGSGVVNSSLTSVGTLGQLNVSGVTTSLKITLNATNSTSDGGGQIYLNGSTGNRIDFNNNGVAAPAVTTRSAGTKIVLNSAVSAFAVDYAFGIEPATLWSSVASSAQQFRWYAGITTIADLKGTGEFLLGTTSLTGTSNQRLQVAGSAYVSGNLGVGATNPLSKLDVRGDVYIGGVDAGPNFIAFRGTTGDQPGGYNHTYIGERIWEATSEKSELVLFKGNDTTGPGPDRVRIIGNEIKFDTYTAATSGTFEGVCTSVNVSNKVTIDQNGNFGIGLTAPTTKLHIIGDIKLEDPSPEIIFRETGFTGTPEWSWAADGGRFSGRLNNATPYFLHVYTNPAVNAIDRIILNGDGGNYPILIGTATSTGTASQQLQVNSGAYVSGNLGVGATNPQTKLDVFGPVAFGTGTDYDNTFSSVVVRQRSAADGYASLSFYPSNGNLVAKIDTINSTNELQVWSTKNSSTGSRLNINMGTTEYISFSPRSVEAARIIQGGTVLIGTATSTGTASQPLQVSGGAYVSGNVGVGTTNPEQPLHITSANPTPVIIQRTAANNTNIEYRNTAGSMWAGLAGNAIGWGIDDDIDIGSAPMFLVTRPTGEVLINSATSTGTASQLLQVTGGTYVSGSVGIGTTNPKSKLHVQGDFLVADVSGIPSIDVNANGTIKLAPFGGNVLVGTEPVATRTSANGAAVAFSILFS